MINSIKFKNYKLFKDWQELELKPITILIGKNSSGKSAIAKLPTLIENSLSGNFVEPLKMNNNGVELGGEFTDLIYGRRRLGRLEIILESKDDTLDIMIGSGTGTKDFPKIQKWNLKNKLSLEYTDKENYYVNVQNEEDCNCDFAGFQLKSFKYKNKEIKESVPTYRLMLNTEYIGPFRDMPQRGYDDLEHDKQTIGFSGKNAYPLLILDSITTGKELISRVSKTYQRFFEGWGLRVNPDRSPYYQIELTKDFLNINIADVGQGMSQILPIVVRALMPDTEETLIIIEQPELHLHPAAHGDLAQLFVETLSDKNKRYLIETHSQNFVLRVRALVAEDVIDQKDLAIYFVNFDEELNESNLERINVDKEGEVDYWPEHIFNESLYESIRIRNAQKQKQKRK